MTLRLDLPISLRAVLESDRSFIFNSWLRSYRSAQLSREHTDTVYFEEQAAVIERLLDRSQVVVACNTDDMGLIYGWLVYEGGPEDTRQGAPAIPRLHYVYVKSRYRRNGIGSRLLLSGGLDKDNNRAVFTSRTHAGDMWLQPFRLVTNIYEGINCGIEESASRPTA